MEGRKLSKLTKSVHDGSDGDPQFNGLVTPIYPSTAYEYVDMPVTLYPRYFNAPNEAALGRKLASLENGESGIVFSSGMAAIMTTLFAFLKSGDHVIFQNDLYGGTYSAVTRELPRYGIGFSFVDGTKAENFAQAILPETRLIYIETPSNPTLKITDIRSVASLARKHRLITVIDNTFASPVNQNPIDLGIDVVVHSGTKYIGGHSDISCGAAVATDTLIKRIHESAIHFGGNLDSQACWLVERSLKTIVLRVRQQNRNAMAIAEFLSTHPDVGRVYYPGLKSHPDHEIARAQMPGGFGGMLSFEVPDADTFVIRLKLIRPAISLGGVESTVTSPAKTSHVKMTSQERLAIGVTDNLLRLSVGIEDADDLIEDLRAAF
jgi:cystathionine beta-lyase/cystathionine gamma-synthase